MGFVDCIVCLYLKQQFLSLHCTSVRIPIKLLHILKFVFQICLCFSKYYFVLLHQLKVLRFFFLNAGNFIHRVVHFGKGYTVELHPWPLVFRDKVFFVPQAGSLLCLPSAGIEGVCHACLASVTLFTAHTSYQHHPPFSSRVCRRVFASSTLTLGTLSFAKVSKCGIKCTANWSMGRQSSSMTVWRERQV